jgi:hypothetical protein
VGNVTRSAADKLRGASSVCFNRNGYVEIEASSDFAFQGGLTIDFWFKSSYSERQYPLSLGDGVIGNPHLYFGDKDYIDGAQVGFWLYWKGNGPNRITSGTRAPVPGWPMASRRDGSQQGNHHSLY